MHPTLMCDPKLLEQDLAGRVYIVTGANSGTGVATAAQLVRQGAEVVAACRRIDASREATKPFAKERGKINVMALDLGNLASVRKFADDFLSHYTRLDGLVNNAGVMNTPEGRTDDGFETQFGVNHLGHYLLSELLLDILKDSAPSRVVCVSSAGHASLIFGEFATIDFDDLHFEQREYSGGMAYMQSKLANVIHARHLAKRLAGTGVSVFSTHPGTVKSNLVRYTDPALYEGHEMLTIEEGAQSQLYCLLSNDAPNHGGEYFSQRSEYYPDEADHTGGWPMRSPNPHAYDDEIAERLDVVSRELVGLARL